MSRFLPYCLLFFAFLLPCTQAQSADDCPNPTRNTPFVFKLPPGLDPSQVSVQFFSNNSCTIKENTNSTLGYYLDSDGVQQPIHLATGTDPATSKNYRYTMKQLTSTHAIGNTPANVPALCLHTFSGRVYISLSQDGLQGFNSGYVQPNPANSSDANNNIRYQYFEPTIDKTGINVDLTYIDLVSIGMGMDAVNAPTTYNNSPQTTTVNTKTLVEAVAGTTSPYAGNVIPSASAILPNKNFLRVLPPMDFSASESPYHSWDDYLTSLHTYTKGTTPQPIIIRGCFNGSTDTADFPDHPERLNSQFYDYHVTIDTDGSATFTPQTDSGVPNLNCGGIATKSSDNIVHGIGNQGSITITAADLKDVNGIYGCDPKATKTYVDPVTNVMIAPEYGKAGNDVFGRIVGDLTAGLNYGFPGSTHLFTSTLFPSGMEVGKMDSQYWWGHTNDKDTGAVIPSAQTPAGQNVAFSVVQSNPKYYNTYANGLLPYTTGYGFAYQDRASKNLLSFNAQVDTASYLRITVNPDISTSSIAAENFLLLQ